MEAVLIGSVVAVALAMFGLTVPWRRLQPHRRPIRLGADVVYIDPPEAGDVVAYAPLRTDRMTTSGDGWQLLLTGDNLDVSTREFANGSTQVWLKRRPA